MKTEGRKEGERMNIRRERNKSGGIKNNEIKRETEGRKEARNKNIKRREKVEKK